jgi:cell division protein FtsQ
MWDKPGILDGISNLLLAAAFLLAAVGAVHYAVRLPVFPLREVRVNDTLVHVTPDQIGTIVRRELQGNFFTLDLAQARAAFEQLPWVRKVNLRRQWPDRLEVALEEHVPLARWGNAALVNTYGEVFTAPPNGALPLFVGPEGSAREIAIRYGYFQRSLAAISQTPAQVRLSPRRAWQIRLASGLTLELGRERIESRLERFIANYDRSIGRLQRELDYADLRYSNGFAVRISEFKLAPQDQRRDGRPARGGLNAKRDR